MSTDDKIKVGYIFDAHGIRGELAVHILSGDSSWTDDLEQLYLFRQNQFEQHRIVRKKNHKRGFICLLENFNDRNKAELFKGSEVWVDRDIFISQEGDPLFLNEILGFEIIDSVAGVLGPIEKFSSNGDQDILVIERPGRSEIEIPFVKDFVTKMDFENKKIWVTLPEGLLEINEKDERDTE